MVVEKRKIGQHFSNKPGNDFVVCLQHRDGVASPLASKDIRGGVSNCDVLVRVDDGPCVIPELSAMASDLVGELLGVRKILSSNLFVDHTLQVSNYELRFSFYCLNKSHSLLFPFLLFTT